MDSYDKVHREHMQHEIDKQDAEWKDKAFAIGLAWAVCTVGILTVTVILWRVSR